MKETIDNGLLFFHYLKIDKSYISVETYLLKEMKRKYFARHVI